MDEEQIARFWSKVDKSDGCWIWTGGQCAGYGWFRVGGKGRYAHRLSFEIAHGHPPPDCVLHRCDTPICVNPAHLFSGSRTDNMVDKMTKGRYRHPSYNRGEGHANSKLTNADVAAIREGLARYQSHNMLARRFGVSKKTITNIHCRRTWKHI